MCDYKKIEEATRLSEYQLKLTSWAGDAKLIQPLQPWADGGSLPWYKGYNEVKYSRVDAFEKANLQNAIDSVAAVSSVLFAQFNLLAFSSNEIVSMHDNWDGWMAHSNSIFWIKPPSSWREDECYGFGAQPFSFMSYEFNS
jgi:hypothetical protein